MANEAWAMLPVAQTSLTSPDQLPVTDQSFGTTCLKTCVLCDPALGGSQYAIELEVCHWRIEKFLESLMWSKPIFITSCNFYLCKCYNFYYQFEWLSFGWHSNELIEFSEWLLEILLCCPVPDADCTPHMQALREAHIVESFAGCEVIFGGELDSCTILFIYCRDVRKPWNSMERGTKSCLSG